ncbi:MAG: PUA domain-containing protein [Nitrosopumilaceae archaeon]
MEPVEKLHHTIDALFGNGISKFLPKKIEITYSKKNGRIRSVFSDQKLLCTLRIDGGLAITPLFAQMLLKSKKFKENCLEIDIDSKPFVEEGRSVFCNHVVWCGKNIQISSDVPVLFKSKVIAVGRAVLSSEMIQSQNRGVAIKIRDSLKSQNKGDRSL